MRLPKSDRVLLLALGLSDADGSGRCADFLEESEKGRRHRSGRRRNDVDSAAAVDNGDAAMRRDIVLLMAASWRLVQVERSLSGALNILTLRDGHRKVNAKR